MSPLQKIDREQMGGKYIQQESGTTTQLGHVNMFADS